MRSAPTPAPITLEELLPVDLLGNEHVQAAVARAAEVQAELDGVADAIVRADEIGDYDLSMALERRRQELPKMAKMAKLAADRALLEHIDAELEEHVAQADRVRELVDEVRAMEEALRARQKEVATIVGRSAGSIGQLRRRRGQLQLEITKATTPVRPTRKFAPLGV